MGLNIVHPDGKEAKTVFRRLWYDKERGESLLHCKLFVSSLIVRKC
jgi:tRNA pseudouridine synthase 9